MAPNEAMRKACAATCADLQKATKSWELLKCKELGAFNALLMNEHTKRMLRIGLSYCRAQIPKDR